MALIKSESAHPMTLVEPLKPRLWNNSEICLLLVVDNNKYLPHVVDNIIFEISIPISPSRIVEATEIISTSNTYLGILAKERAN